MPVPPANDALPSQVNEKSADYSALLKEQGLDSNLNAFYQYLSPSDISQRLKFPGADSSTVDKVTGLYSVLEKNYVKSTQSGKKIIEALRDITDLPEKGVGYNTVYIDKSGRGLFLDGDYWTTANMKPSHSDPGPGQEFALDSFYQNLCATSGEAPSVPATINVLRMPYLSQARKNVDVVSVFMNYMPPLFANQLVPYFDVEFQFGDQPQAVDKTTGLKTQYLNHPSILRFLLGSSVPVEKIAGSLTEVDQALLSSLSSPVKQGGSTAGAQGATTAQQITVSGMELFTTPQTLTNMKTLKANGAARLLDVKPFLPPATLTNASITVMPSSMAPSMASRNASLELKLYDRARLVEFSDFIKGVSGNKDVSIWITYGWLAPRGRGNEDFYAKFINENMLVRYCFMVKNSSFSFDATGLITLKLELLSKSVESLAQSRIDTTGTKMQEALKRVSQVLRAIHRRRAGYKNKQAEAEQANGANKEIRIFQILDAAEAGKLDLGLDPGVVNDTIKKELERLKAENPVDQKNVELMRYVQELYEIDGDTKMPKYKMEMEKLAKDYAKEKFKALESPDNDPFLPRPGKKGQYQFFGDDLIQAMKDVGQDPATAAATGGPSKGHKGGASSKGGGGGGKGGGGGGGKGFDPKAPKKKYDPSRKDLFGSWESSVHAAGGRDEWGNYYPDLDPAHDNGQFGPPPPPPTDTSSSSETSSTPATSTALITPDIPQYTPAEYDPTADPIV